MTTDTPADAAARPADVSPEAAPPAPAAEPPAESAPPPEPAPPAAEEKPTADESPADGEAAPTANGAPEEAPKAGNKHWYVVKVQSGREESVKDAIERRVKIEGLEQYFGQVVVPVERETVTIQSGKRKGQKQVKKRKKFPGYIMAEVEYNDKILYLFRETSGVGDFVGGSLTRAPVPMSEREVQAMLRDQDDVKGLPAGKKAKLPPAPAKLPFNVGDKVRVKEGIFAGQEGEVKEIREPKEAGDLHKIRVELTVFGRPTSVQLEHWQIESV
jgi:transcriptional antiterminator NusG